MKTESAIKKLEAAGYNVESNGTYFEAVRGDNIVTFNTSAGNVKSFSQERANSCSATYGLKLAQVL